MMEHPLQRLHDGSSVADLFVQAYLADSPFQTVVDVEDYALEKGYELRVEKLGRTEEV